MRSHKILNSPPITHPDFQFTTREEADFMILLKGPPRCGVWLPKERFNECKWDVNCVLIKGVEPFSVPQHLHTGVGMHTIGKTDVVQAYVMNKNKSYPHTE